MIGLSKERTVFDIVLLIWWRASFRNICIYCNIYIKKTTTGL